MLFTKPLSCYRSIYIVLLCLNPSVITYADHFEKKAVYQAYFRPQDNCTLAIVSVINSAQHTIYVQAYYLTLEPILSALIAAKARKVDVQIILDHHHRENQIGIQRMREASIPIWIDQDSGIAHNKIMIIDEQRVITGSFNFSYSANHNRENILIIRDKGLAQRYVDNWYACKARCIVSVTSLGKKPTKKKSKDFLLTLIDIMNIRRKSLRHTRLFGLPKSGW